MYADKIAKLLIKAEKTQTSEEAAVFFEKAQELMVKYQISDADVRAAKKAGEPDKIIASELYLGKSGAAINAKRTLAFDLCRIFTLSGFTRNHAGIFVFCGYESEVRFVEKLYTILLMHAEQELQVALKKKPSWTHGNTFRREFYEAFNETVTSRIREQQRKATEKAEEELGHTSSVALVLRDRQDLVDNYVAENFKLRTVSRRVATNYCGHARAKGAKAGRTADITPNTGKVSGSKGVLGK